MVTPIELTEKPAFPPVDRADDNGLLAYGGDLSVERLLAAYQKGIFPWYGPGEPILWWSPDPRLIIEPAALRVSRSLAKDLRRKRFRIFADTRFRDVIEKCAEVPRPRQKGTWIVPEMIEAYFALHEAGYAHSIEVTREEKLVGGLYGVAIGKAFFGESMFSIESNASKAGLVRLVELLAHRGYHFIDCQQSTRHLKGFGAVEISRGEFVDRLEKAVGGEIPPGKWRI